MHHITILLEQFNTDEGREDIFTDNCESLREIRRDIIARLE
jgi:hypothetical protein